MASDRYESPEESLARLLQRKRYAQAIEILRVRLAQRRPDPRTRLRLADLLLAAGRKAEAVPVLLALSDELAAAGELSKAVAALKRVENLEPQRADVQRKLQRLVAERQRLLTLAAPAEPAPEAPPAPGVASAVAQPSSPIAGPPAPPEDASAEPLDVPAGETAGPEPADGPVALRFRGLLGRLLGDRPEGAADQATGEGPAGEPPDEGPEIGLAPLPMVAAEEPPATTPSPKDEPGRREEPAPPAPPTPAPVSAAAPGPTPAPVPPTPTPSAPTAPPVERTPERRSGFRSLLGRLFGRPSEPAAGESAATLPPAPVASPEPPSPAPEAAPSAGAAAPGPSQGAGAAGPSLALPGPTTEPAPPGEPESGAPAAPPAGEPEPTATATGPTNEPEPTAAAARTDEPEAAAAAPTGEPDATTRRAEAPMSEAAFHERLLDVVEEMLRRDSPGGEVPVAATARAAQSLQASPLVGELDEAELGALLLRLRLRTCEPGDILLSEGEPGETLFLLVGGTVKVFVRNQESHNVPVLDLREGDFFGEVSVLSGRPRSATVTAATPCELLELDRPTLDELARSHPGIVDTLEAFYLARTQSAAAATLREAALGPEARRRAQAVLRSHFGAGGFDPRTQLKLADALLRSGKRDDALAILASLAEDLARHGYPEKAFSILKKVERLQGRGIEEIQLAPLRREDDGPEPADAQEPAGREQAFHGWLVDLVRDSVDHGGRGRVPATAPGLLMSPLFEDFAEEELLSLVRGLRLVSLDAGDVVVSEGEAGNSVFVITGGCVKVFVHDPAGRNVLVGRLAEGDFFGEISLLSGRPRSATVTAAAPCELLELDREAFDRVCAQHPRVRAVMEDVYIQRAGNPLAARVRATGQDD